MRWLNPENRGFVHGCCVQIALLGVAAVLAIVFKRHLFDGLFWRGSDVMLGLAATVPMLLVFWWVLKSSTSTAANIRQFLDRILPPFFGQWSLGQLAVISLLAGLCEETLFRGVLQAGISASWGKTCGLLLSGVAFGLAHAINRGYVIGATIVGFFMGWLYLLTGNFLAPVVAHAVYDFCALSVFLRWYRGDPR